MCWRQRFIPHHFCLWLVAILLLAACGEAPEPELSDRDYIKQAEALSQAKRYRETVLVLKQALLANPKNTEARWMLGLNYLHLGKALSAEKELRRARELGLGWNDLVLPLSEAWLRIGKPDKVLTELSNLSLFPAHLHPRLWVMIGRAQLNKGQFSEAFDAARQAKALKRDFLELARFEARLALTQRHVSLAAPLIEQGLEQWPDDDILARFQARLWLLEGRYKQAGSAFFKLGNRQSADVLYQRDMLNWSAFSMLLAADQAAYKVVKQRFKQRFPGDARHEYLNALELMAGGEWARSESILSAYAQKRPDDSSAKYLLALVHLAQQNWQQGLDFLNQYSNQSEAVLAASQLEAIARHRLGQVHPSSVLLTRLVLSHSQGQGQGMGGEPLVNLASLSLDGVALSSPDFLLHYESLIRGGFVLPVQAENPTGFAKWITAPLRSGKAHFPGLLGQFRRLSQNLPLNDQLNGLIDAIELRDFDFAQGLIDKLENDDRIATHVRLAEGLLLLEQGRITKARDHLRRLYEEDGSNPVSARFYATALVEAGDLGKARAVLEKALSGDAQNPGLGTALAAIYIAMSEIDKAFDLIMGFEAISPGYAPMLARYSLLKGRLESAKSFLLQQGDQQDEVSRLWSLAVLGDWAQVQKGVSERQKSSPSNLDTPGMLVVRGALAKQYNDIPAAIGIWRQLIQVLPDDHDLQVTLIELYRQVGQFDEALALARGLQRKEVHLARGHVLAGDILMEKADFRSAYFAYQSAFNMAAERSILLKRLAAQKRIPDWGTAAVDLEQWLDWHQDDDEVRRLLIDASFKSGNHQRAIEAAEDWMLRNKADLVLLHQLIEWLDTDDPVRMQQLIAQGRQDFPQDPEIFESELKVLEKTQKWSEMARALKVFQQQNGASPRWRWWQAKTLVGSGESAKALEMLKAVLKKPLPQETDWVDSARKLLSDLEQQKREAVKKKQ